ncbi:MAG: threonine-phosphate decarboxylase [Deltaproteobacteria bacterium RIFOXYD12_FULL_50_9]|nr:MAG: threonine-phosphate decarboxylase [Deltaproteobacteria bacterium RIFOXYD12_FULL_50_9]
MTFGHGGNITRMALEAGRTTDEILDFSANINPLGPPAGLRRILSSHWERLRHYPDPEATELVNAIAGRYHIEPEQIILGNGSTEIIYAIPRALKVKRAIIPAPCYADYQRAAELAGVSTISLAMPADLHLDFATLTAQLKDQDLVFLGSPNNPTGQVVDYDQLIRLAVSHPTTVLVVDESFAEFDPNFRSVLAANLDNLIMVRSLTKFYSIPGLRLGMACASPAVAQKIRPQILPWSVNTLAQAAGCLAMHDTDYGNRTREAVGRLRHDLSQGLAEIGGLFIYPSHANFLLVQITGHPCTAHDLANRLLKEGIAIRICDNYPGLDDGGRDFFRVSVRTEEENGQLLMALRQALVGTTVTKPARRHPFTLMFQGTSSNAGKSVLTAALCRILLQDGLRIAPFKAQNMSLNSFVTRDGLEMGRAQVVQAQACRLDPDVRMNPVLLKPTGAVGCQVIVNGKPVSNMAVSDYIAYKTTAWPAACAAFDSLAAEFDGVILEGAGSPGEVNLKHHDIVNMRMARYAKAPVLLVGDIDRGGVFASFIGTIEVLDDWERQLIAGFVVNRFRGDQTLLTDALHYTRQFTNRPVLGVVPFLPALGLPEEDSVSFKAGLFDSTEPIGEYIEIALIDLPHISNFTDFEPLLIEPDLHLRVVRTVADLEKARNNLTAIFLPGSKSVINDLDYLRQSGMADCLLDLAKAGKTEIIGICGGYQMLGKTINDPYRLESAGLKRDGLGLLAMETVLAAEKTLIRTTARHLPSNLTVHGYEIHHGQSETAERPILLPAEGQAAGAGSADGLIWGCYLHGIFDADPFRRWFIDRLRIRRGLPPIGKIQAIYDLEPAFDRLANCVRQSLEMDKIYQLLKL